MSVEVYGRELDEVELNEMFYQETGILKNLDNLKIFNWLKWERDCLEINRSLKKLGLKHLHRKELRKEIRKIKKEYHPLRKINSEEHTNMMKEIIPPDDFLESIGISIPKKGLEPHIKVIQSYYKSF